MSVSYIVDRDYRAKIRKITFSGVCGKHATVQFAIVIGIGVQGMGGF